MSVTKQDFVGFTYNGKHSSELGIVRVSDGSRFNENLLPTIKDKTVQVPGGDGTYYFGSEYTQRQFTINFAFDSLTEERIRELKTWLGDKKIHKLSFDEAEHKEYLAKVTGTATIKHIPFDQPSGTVYKGEGSIQFTCYYPFARATTQSIGGVNTGDVPVPFTLVLDPSAAVKRIEVGGKTLTWESLPSKALLDTSTGIAYKMEGNSITNEIMNRYIIGDSNVKIPVNEVAPVGAKFYCLYF